ncbi:hypothetical protein V8E55_006021 [Tylopilus felleus]
MTAIAGFRSRLTVRKIFAGRFTVLCLVTLVRARELGCFIYGGPYTCFVIESYTWRVDIWDSPWSPFSWRFLNLDVQGEGHLSPKIAPIS